MRFPAHESAASDVPAPLIIVEPFAVEVERRRHLTIVRPRGELDLATADTLRGTLDAAIAGTLEDGARLVLDLRGLSFIDSTGLHLLVDLDQRAQRDGFELQLLAPAAPINRVIQLCGLDRTLPFAEHADGGSEALRDVS